MDGFDFKVADGDEFALNIDFSGNTVVVTFGFGLILYTDDFTEGWMGFPDEGPRAAWSESSSVVVDGREVVNQSEMYREAARLGLVEVKPASETPPLPLLIAERTGQAYHDHSVTLLEKSDPT
jgi:hypothetical protein